MALKDILVHMDNTPYCTARLDLAIALAWKHQARLTGLYVITHAYYEPRHGSAERDAADAVEIFNRKTSQTGISAEWRCIERSVVGASMTEILIRQSHYNDLVIVGQSDHAASGKKIPHDLPERLVLGAGRPVLVVPYTGVFNTVGERVLVAWKEGRESTRAVNDALPFLKRAEQVKLLAVTPSGKYEEAGRSPSVDICAHLARHGVNAVAEQVPVADISIGDVLLNQAYEEGFDLLVMGAYAHAPQGIPVLGPVAGHLLRHMTVPVLMSH